MEEKAKCPICGKVLKSQGGLAGHMRLEHGQRVEKTYPDEIGERLTALEKMLGATANPAGKRIDSEEELRKVLTGLLPAIEKYGLAVCCFEKYLSYDPNTAVYRIVKNSQIESFGLGSNKICVVLH